MHPVVEGASIECTDRGVAAIAANARAANARMS
jgi:hypothetical protein